MKRDPHLVENAGGASAPLVPITGGHLPLASRHIAYRDLVESERRVRELLEQLRAAVTDEAMAYRNYVATLEVNEPA